MAKCNACGGTVKPSINPHWVDKNTGEKYHIRCVAGNCAICNQLVPVKNSLKQPIMYYKDNPSGDLFHKLCLEQNPKWGEQYGKGLKAMPKQFRKGTAQAERDIRSGYRQVQHDSLGAERGIRRGAGQVQRDIQRAKGAVGED